MPFHPEEGFPESLWYRIMLPCNISGISDNYSSREQLIDHFTPIIMRARLLFVIFISLYRLQKKGKILISYCFKNQHLSSTIQTLTSHLQCWTHLFENVNNPERACTELPPNYSHSFFVTVIIQRLQSGARYTNCFKYYYKINLFVNLEQFYIYQFIHLTNTDNVKYNIQQFLIYFETF